VIKQIIQFLGRKLSSGEDGKTTDRVKHYVPLSVYDDGITFGYARNGESIDDLR
jgi:hypothetical protein